MRWLSLHLLLFIHTYSAHGLECTIEGITDKCQYFQKNKSREIDLGDGTFIPNDFAGYGTARSSTQTTAPSIPPSYDQQSYDAGISMPTYDPKLQMEIRQKSLNAQAILLKDPGITGSDAFKIALTDATTLAQLGFPATTLNLPKMSPAESLEPVYEPQLMIPWPPESDKIQIVPLDKFKSEYLNKLPETSRKNILAQAKIVTDANQSLYAAYQPPAPPPPPPKPTYAYCMAQIADAKKCKATAQDQPPILTPERAAQVVKLAEKTRSLLIEEILAGRKLEALSSDEQFMIEKIKLIKIKNQEIGVGSEYLQAQYRYGSHTILLQPKLNNLPDQSIVGIVAHELAHAIDPCHVHSAVYEILPKESTEKLSPKNGLRPPLHSKSPWTQSKPREKMANC